MKFFTTIAAAAVLLPLAIAAPAPTDSTDVSFDATTFNGTVYYDDLPEAVDDEIAELSKRKVTPSSIQLRTYARQHCQASATIHKVGYNAKYSGHFKSFLLMRDLKLGESIRYFSDDKCTQKIRDSNPLHKGCYNVDAKCFMVWRHQGFIAGGH